MVSLTMILPAALLCNYGRELCLIDVGTEGIKPDDVDFATRMFHRRHVYEHKGGEADEKYILDSGDASVRPKQALHETQESAHRLVNLVRKLAGNLHRGFHEIFPPERGRIDAYAKRQSVPDH